MVEDESRARKICGSIQQTGQSTAEQRIPSPIRCAGRSVTFVMVIPLFVIALKGLLEKRKLRRGAKKAECGNGSNLVTFLEHIYIGVINQIVFGYPQLLHQRVGGVCAFGSCLAGVQDNFDFKKLA